MGRPGTSTATGPPGTAGTTAASVAATVTTTSTTYTGLTGGPTVTVTIPASGNALVIVTAAEFGSQGGSTAFMSFTAGAQAASDARALAVAGNDLTRASATSLVNGLTPGPVTFTAQYRVSSGTGTFSNRDIVVIPLP
jgi:hypothetical protein